MTTRIAITSSLFLGLAMLLIPSAQAMSPPPLHQSDGISTEASHRGGEKAKTERDQDEVQHGLTFR